MIYVYFGFGLLCLMFFLYRHYTNKHVEIFRHEILIHFVRNDKYPLLMSHKPSFMESCNVLAAQELVSQGFLNSEREILSVGQVDNLTITFLGYEYLKNKGIDI